VNGSLALTSDYVWRGVSQSNDSAAVQASLKLTGDGGFYGSVWASNVEFAPALEASSEFDVIVGWSGAISDNVALDVSLVHYLYPSTTADLDWTEASATMTVASNYWLSAGWSNDALALDVDGLYLQAGARLPVGERFRLEGLIGHYDVDNAAGPDTYLHGQVNAIWVVSAPVELRLSLHDTNGSGETLYGDRLAGQRIELALQAGF
jgi:uncharacterized protein (TIGR02001 family)